MKVKDIVSEHKKGFRANIYQRKKQTAPQPAQTAPVKPGAEKKGVAEDMAPQVYKVTKNDPNTGVTLAKPDGTQLILPPDKVNAIASNPNDPNKYLLNPDAVTQAQQGQPTGPEIGREVEVNDQMEIPTAEGNDESGDVGGDPTDQYIDDVVDHDFEKAQNRDNVSVLKHLAGLK